MSENTRKYDVASILDSLFQRAKQRDEFEYICALSGFDMLGQGVNLLAETWSLLRDVVGLLDAPLRPEARLRLGLLLYCHLIEAKPIYATLENMLFAMEGERCCIDPFFDLCRVKNKNALMPERIPPSSKKVFAIVVAHARRVGEHELADMLEAVLDDGLRNAFFHADYCIMEDGLWSRHSWFEEDGVKSQLLTLSDVVKRVQNAFAFYRAFEHVYVQHRLSYKEPKMIRGRFGPNDSWVDIYVYTDPSGGGLTGFGNMPEPVGHGPGGTESRASE
ncbi:MAG: hypothetical protein AMXMBFR13_31510 [Phycisphaerae bacterium]